MSPSTPPKRGLGSRATPFVAGWILFLLAMPALAGPRTWSSQGPEGGTIVSLAVDPTAAGTLYAGTSGGLYKTTDHGDTWTRMDRGLGIEPFLGIVGDGLPSVAIDPRRPDTVYTARRAERDRIYRSTDGAETWSPIEITVPLGSPLQLIVVDPSDPSNLYVATLGGLVRSTDGGATWEEITTGFPDPFVHDLAVDPSSSPVLYAATGSGVAKSTDGGHHWSTLGGLPEGRVEAVAVDPQAPATVYAVRNDGVFKSTNGGASWSGAPSGPRGGTDLVVDPAVSRNLYLSTLNNRVWASTDGGTSWHLASQGILPSSVSVLAISPADPSVVYAGSFYGVFRSWNRGSLWSAVDHGLVGSSVVSLAAAPDGPILFAGVQSGGLFRSRDGGASWEGPSPFSVPFGAIDALAVDSLDPRRVYASAGVAAFQTFDGGDSWSRLFGVTGVSEWAIDPTDPSTIYAGSRAPAGVFRTLDGGETWSQVARDGLEELRVSSIALDPRHPSTLYAGTFEGGLYRTTNGGAGWSRVGDEVFDFGVFSVAIAPATPTRVYASRIRGGLFRSTDGGATWVPLDDPALSGTVQDLVVDPVHPSVLYAAGELGVARSTDFGDTWVRLGDEPQPGPVAALVLDPGNPEKVYAGSGGGGVADLDLRQPTVWFTPGELPGFRIGVRISTAVGEDLPVRREVLCIPETLCVSGSVPGRSELFLRIVGPKPNGYLWPTLVRFSTSALDVWIEQTGTGVTQHYRLEAAGPGSSDLTGLFDRTGFLP